LENTAPSSRLYGITHDVDGAPRIIEQKIVKVSIGLPRGKAMHAYIDAAGKWQIICGIGDKMKRQSAESLQDAKRVYYELKKSAPDRKFPGRLPYFTFLQVSPSGEFEPDWDIIQSHGPIPTKIEISFIRDDPFFARYEMYSQVEKKCEGDGKIGLRINTLAETDEEKALAKEAQAAGRKHYPIIDKCFLGGCHYAKPTTDKAAPCGPMGRLFFQLLKSPRLGGTAVFSTSGYRSISQIFSSLEIFKRATSGGNPGAGFVAGIPLDMVLRPYSVSHHGQKSIQYAVGLEFAAENVFILKKKLIELGVQYRIAGRDQLNLLEPGSSVINSPAALLAEFEPGEMGVSGLEAPADEIIEEPAGALASAWEIQKIG
jgi:hypothetical protein